MKRILLILAVGLGVIFLSIVAFIICGNIDWNYSNEKFNQILNGKSGLIESLYVTRGEFGATIQDKEILRAIEHALVSTRRENNDLNVYTKTEFNAMADVHYTDRGLSTIDVSTLKHNDNEILMSSPRGYFDPDFEHLFTLRLDQKIVEKIRAILKDLEDRQINMLRSRPR